MVTVDASATAVDGVTLVTVHLTDADIDRRVRVEHRLDGPVWPPRREGRPEAGWDERGYEGVVPADGGLAIGYATPAPPRSDPVAVDEGDPAQTDSGNRDRPSAPDAVVRDLGDPSPPRAAVPLPDDDDGSVPDPDEPEGNEDRPTEETADVEPGNADDADGQTGPAPPRRETGESVATGDTDSGDPVTEWFAAVERRLETVERLDAADSVPAATTALRDAGGLDGARRAERAVAADRRRLVAIANRANRLAERAEATDVPLETLERLA